jgi:hypothetical protein
MDTFEETCVGNILKNKKLMLENICTPMGQIPLKRVYFYHADSGVHCGIVSGGTNNNGAAILQCTLWTLWTAGSLNDFEY